MGSTARRALFSMYRAAWREDATMDTSQGVTHPYRSQVARYCNPMVGGTAQAGCSGCGDSACMHTSTCAHTRAHTHTEVGRQAEVCSRKVSGYVVKERPSKLLKSNEAHTHTHRERERERETAIM